MHPGSRGAERPPLWTAEGRPDHPTQSEMQGSRAAWTGPPDHNRGRPRPPGQPVSRWAREEASSRELDAKRRRRQPHVRATNRTLEANEPRGPCARRAAQVQTLAQRSLHRFQQAVAPPPTQEPREGRQRRTPVPLRQPAPRRPQERRPSAGHRSRQLAGHEHEHDAETRNASPRPQAYPQPGCIAGAHYRTKATRPLTWEYTREAVVSVL